MFLQPGTTIGQFTIRELIGNGAVVDVYKAFDAKRQRVVAIEVPTTTPLDHIRLIREANVVAGLNHPNIVDVLEVATASGVPYIVSEFVNGRTLDEHLLHHRDSTQQVLDLLAQVAEGLQAAHANSVVHRDVKPSNILVTDAHRVKVLDFGLTGAAINDDVVVRSSLSYLAPEQLRGSHVDAQTDIFSLGIVAYEALTGRNPFIRPSVVDHLDAVLNESPAPAPGMPANVQRVIGQMLAKNPRERPTAHDVVRGFRSIDTPVVIRREQSKPEAFQVHFPDAETYYAALAAESPALAPTAASERRQFFSVDVSTSEGLRQLRLLEERYGATVVEDYQYDMDFRVFDPEDAVLPELTAPGTLEDVLHRIHAPEAWVASRGEGVAIAIVDTGIDGNRPEFGSAKRAGAWQPIGDDAWIDRDGHGTMCATIAAAPGGTFTGVAPDASVISCKVNFKDSQLALAYDYLADLARSGMRIVASNSWGTYTGTAPTLVAKAQFPSALQGALDAGVIVVCSAGNYHDLTSGGPTDCGPTSIWLHKCRADLLTVATCKLDGQMWFYSSRGPGQHFGDDSMSRKPDVTAPTPENGLILYGSTTRVLMNGWGTSGAAPQVAGLAALMISCVPGTTRAEIHRAIRDTAEPLTCPETCCGAGIINCRAALTQVTATRIAQVE